MFLFLIICVSITTFLIFQEKESQPEVENHHIPTIELSGTYNENSIKIQEITIPANEDNDVELHYYQISGLKDKAVEDIVNNNIKASALRMSQYYSPEEYQNRVQSQNIISNFANVLCFKTYASANTRAENRYSGKTEYHAFNLVDGGEIKFQDLFMDDTDIIAILSSEIYEDLIWDSKEDELSENEGDYTVWNRLTEKIDENKLVAKVKYLSDAIRDGTLSFYFDPHCIRTEDNIFLYIEMEKYISDIAIYTRYLTEDSIYEDDSLGTKGLFNFSKRDTSDDLLLLDYFGPQTDNLFIDGIVLNWERKEKENPIFQQVFQDVITKAKEEIESEITFANSNPDKKMYINFSYEIQWLPNSHSDRIIDVKKYYKKFVMDATYYDEIFLDCIAKSYRIATEMR